jgi:murein DD-endopeptidase MepM/ murein hydrolase activator NlpD
MSRDREDKKRIHHDRREPGIKRSATVSEKPDDIKRRAGAEALPRQRSAGYHDQTGDVSKKPIPKVHGESSVKKPSRLIFSPDETATATEGKGIPPPSRSPVTVKEAANNHAKAMARRRIKRKLYFENDPNQKSITANTAKPLPAYAADAGRVSMREKIHESADDNVGIDAAVMGEAAAEGTVSTALRRNSDTRKKRAAHKTSLYREGAEVRGSSSHNVGSGQRGRVPVGAGQRKSAANPKISGNKGSKSAYSRIIQKRRIKRGYSVAAKRKGANAAGKAASVVQSKAKRAFSAAARHPAIAGIIGALVLLLVIIFAAFSSCTNVSMGGLTNIAASSYLAENADIDDAELYYTEWETDLLIQAQGAESAYPGYDEYKYNIGDVSHSPYNLMAYLTVKYNDFAFAEISNDLREIFYDQYTLLYTEKIETRYRTEQRINAAGETVAVSVPYEYKILHTTLSAKSFSDIILPLMDRSELERYALIVQSKGNRQIAGSPLDSNWLPYVTSDYGYRIHPVTGEKSYHRGVDIGIGVGTKVRAAHDGIISTGNDAGGYGKYITLTGKDGLITKYAHLSEFIKGNGRTVSKGDVIAETGNTGNSTGPHLHFEIIKDGRYLNPLYFAITNDDGSPPPGTGGGREIPEYPGAPMEDEAFTALMEEAQKHLGKPYVFGASGPNSFDCSGFVCYVFKHSGVKNIERTNGQVLYSMCTPVSANDVKPGDLVFFAGTYSTTSPISHVGIYIGNGKMINAGDPVKYADLSAPYWQNHFYAYGRL